MAFRLIISNRADEQIDSIISYVENNLQNLGAATSIYNDIQDSYSKLEYMADVYPLCDDPYLKLFGYRKKLLSKHDYVIVFRLHGNDVHISGVFHMLEDYATKL